MNAKLIAFISLIILINLTLCIPSIYPQSLKPDPYNDIDDNYIYRDYAKSLKTIISNNGLVNYKTLLNNPKDLNQFIMSLESIQEEEYNFWSEKDRIAFWINIYNAFTLKTIIDNYPIIDLKKKQSLWKKKNFRIMGKRISLEEIKEEFLHKKYNEPKIFMALCDGTKGSGILRNEPYTGNKLTQQLNQQAQMFLTHLNNFEIILNNSQINISPLFKRYSKDFIENYATDKKYKGLKESERAVMNFIEQYLPPEKRSYLYTKIFFINFNEYNWDLNDIDNNSSIK